MKVAMKGVEEAMVVAVSAFLLMMSILVAMVMMTGGEPNRPDVPASNINKTTCSSNDDCKLSREGASCITINTVKGTQRFCGCISQDDCSGYAAGVCGESGYASNKCA